MKKFFGASGLPVFDLVLLGMGEDGHTASLFPGSKSLQERARLAVPVYLGGSYGNRITLTLPVLDNAAQILFLVAGSSKATVLSEILSDGKRKGEFPAERIRPVKGRVIWLIDREAAQGV
jgi:6-phosphogluconolactonase